VAREIKLHIGLVHPSIISLYAAWKDRNYVYMALEWAPGVRVCVCVRACVCVRVCVFVCACMRVGGCVHVHA